MPPPNRRMPSPTPSTKRSIRSQANGPIFVDWPKPDVALVFSGEQDGYLEPCGCAGLENQKGGLKRRFTLLKELRDKGWPVVAMDFGGQEKRTGVQAEIKFDFALRALAKMGYAAVGFGPNDLRLDLLSHRHQSGRARPIRSSRPMWQSVISTAASRSDTRSLKPAA